MSCHEERLRILREKDGFPLVFSRTELRRIRLEVETVEEIELKKSLSDKIWDSRIRRKETVGNYV